VLGNNLRGIWFIVIGTTISSLQDTLIKLLSDDLSIFQIQFVRSTIGIVSIILFQIFIRQPVILTTAYPALSILRGILFFFAYSAFYLAQSKMPIANATVLFLVSPFFITILSILFFKSQVGYKHWITMLVGFFGIVLICQPTTGEFNFYYLLPILVALSYALIVNISKLTADKDTLYQQVLYMYFITALLSGLAGLLLGDGRFDTVEYSEIAFVVRAWEFSSLKTVIWLLAISVVGATALLFLLGAYRLADPSVISPYEYTLLLWMVLWGYIFWRDVPSLNVVVGMLFVVGAGLYLFYKERAKVEKSKCNLI
jgi:drug/metabolite transporter (DMT)-like permease